MLNECETLIVQCEIQSIILKCKVWQELQFSVISINKNDSTTLVVKKVRLAFVPKCDKREPSQPSKVIFTIPSLFNYCIEKWNQKISRSLTDIEWD
jgi:hypothetical protein